MDLNEYVISLSGQPRYDPQGHITGYLGTGDDITADINILGEVTRLSLTDPLTNVANKRAFERDLKSALEIADKANPVYLMALDLDDFKPINDTYGHSAGDKVIQIIAQRIQSQLRSDAFLARTGGDEFCIVCTLGKSQTHIQPLAQRIRQTVLQPIRLSKTVQVQVGVSIGIAMAPLIGASPEQLICAADRALYEAKREGRQLIRIAASGPERADGSNLPREGHGMVSPESVARPAAHMMG